MPDDVREGKTFPDKLRTVNGPDPSVMHQGWIDAVATPRNESPCPKYMTTSVEWKKPLGEHHVIHLTRSFVHASQLQQWSPTRARGGPCGKPTGLMGIWPVLYCVGVKLPGPDATLL
ncbi:hypothetical protein N7462_007039 [Penicillium macrosclerotiorum]|uniref:uncharacterized protein n=1 Tax=Penicillium macrosclerotiorum TaxID=303699 RepID=UPI0025475DBE|nr:uncharacterized protein N7462_007039 [Penicillium macrosclerotiorum]KAJ5678795.1 hypothetical protein N7462_007039 [Penicillium macrosclerotiorum]